VNSPEKRNGFVVPQIVMGLQKRQRIGYLGGIARQAHGDRNHEALRLRRFSWQSEAE
jgi:hypothetical protein